jgi:hypothetical protein
VLGHHDLKVTNAKTHFCGVFGVTFEKRRDIEAVLVADPLAWSVTIQYSLEELSSIALLLEAAGG